MTRKAGIFIEARTDMEAVTDVFIFDQIDSMFGISAKEFTEQLQDISGDLEVWINSPGGDVFDGMAIYNSLNRYEGHVAIHIVGVAASIASLIAMAGDTVRMAETSLFMIHDPRGFAGGTSADMERMQNALEKAATAMASAYVRKTGMDATEVRDLMKAETWYTAEEAVEANFVDEITNATEDDDAADMEEAIAAAAEFKMVAQFQHIPDALKKPTATTVPTRVGKPRKPAMTKKVGTPSEPGTGEEPVSDDAKAITAAVEAATLKAKEDEQERRKSIRGIFALTNTDDHAKLMATCLDDMDCSEDDAKTQLLAAIGKGAKPAGTDPDMTPGKTADEKRIEGMSIAILARAGLGEHDPQNNWNGYTLCEMARASLEANGFRTARMDKMRMTAAAITHSTSDFPNILIDAANKSMLKGYSEAPETWSQIARVGNLSDFKIAHRVGTSEFEDLTVVNENGEFESGSMGDRRETIQLATYGKLFNLSRQTLINDDLGAFTSVPRKMGRAASRTVGNTVWGIITANAALSDGIVLFHASHSNLAGSGAAPTTATLDAGRVAMALQTDQSASATALNIRPSKAFVPVELEGAMRVVLTSDTEIAASQNNSRKPNSVKNLVSEVVSEARLSADSTTAWYLAADHNAFDTVEAAFLDGNQNPFLEQQNGWSVDGTQFKVRIDVGAAALEFRTLYKNAGA